MALNQVTRSRHHSRLCVGHASIFDLILVPLVPLLYLSPTNIYGLDTLFESVLHLSSAERRHDPRYLETLHGNRSRVHPKPRREMDPSVQKQDFSRSKCCRGALCP